MKSVILVHGGVGTVVPSQHAAVKAGCLAAAQVGSQALKTGKDALGAVIEAVAVLEDNPLFNAGRGAALTAVGTVELDAAVMRGIDLSVGAVACVTRARNPIYLARAVMDSEHVLLVGNGADDYAREVGLEEASQDYFVTEQQRDKLEAWRRTPQIRGTGTVGAVALDVNGRFAAATSTGGRTGKRPGRVGDTPVVGAGTYANQSAAVSGTGEGEYFIRSLAAYLAAEAAPRIGAQAAVERGVAAVAQLGGSGGLILIGPEGEIGVAFNTLNMARAWIKDEETFAAV